MESILREGPFKDIWIQPAAGDAGGALGAALLLGTWQLDHGSACRIPGATPDAGAPISARGSHNDDIERRLDGRRGLHDRERRGRDDADRVAELFSGKGRRLVQWVGWSSVRGRLERASILGDRPQSEMQATMNLKIKFRESFRPFAPSRLRERSWPSTSISTMTARTCCWSPRAMKSVAAR
jgi:carbamoyltransferase